MQWVPTLKRKGIETDHSSTSNVKFKNEWSYNSTSPYALITCTEATLSVEMFLGYFKISKYSEYNPLSYKNSWYCRLAYLPTYWKKLQRRLSPPTKLHVVTIYKNGDISSFICQARGAQILGARSPWLTN